MDKKSMIIVWFCVALVLLSIGFTFYKTVILQDFEVIDSSEEYEEELDNEEELSEEDSVTE